MASLGRTLVVVISFIATHVFSLNHTECRYLSVSPPSFAYSGWFEYSTNDKKFGSAYWFHLSAPFDVHLLLYQHQWYFYNWDTYQESYVLQSDHSSTNSNEQQLQLSINSTSTSTWNSLQDGSQIELHLSCWPQLNQSIASTISTFNTSTQQIEWLISNENCHRKPRGYVAFITPTQSHTGKVTAYWDRPTLSNHTSNITVSVSGKPDDDQFATGQSQITYAAENANYFIMCQITIYIISGVSEDDIAACTKLENGRIGVIDLIVDRDSFSVIDTEQYYYDALDTVQVLYIIPDFQSSDVTCYVNINWAKMGEARVSVSSGTNSIDSSNDAFIVYKILIILCMILLCGLLVERVYFYRHSQQTKYRSMSMHSMDSKEDDRPLSELMDDMDSLRFPMSVYQRNRDRRYPSRSLSVSAAATYPANGHHINMSNAHTSSLQGMNPVQSSNARNNGRNKQKQGRAMSMQISSYPFTRPPTKAEFLERRTRNHLNDEAFEEMVPLSIVLDDEEPSRKSETFKQRKKRHRSVPMNLMSDKALQHRQSATTTKSFGDRNNYDDADFWKKELNVLAEAGFGSKQENLSMLIKYAVRNEQDVVDRKMTQSIVLRMLQRKQADDFLETQWHDDADQSNHRKNGTRKPDQNEANTL